MSDILKDVRSHCGSSQTVNVNLLVIPHIFCGYSVGYQSGQFIIVPVFIEILCHGSICHLIGHVIVMQSTCTLKKDGCFLTTEWLATLVAWHIRG